MLKVIELETLQDRAFPRGNRLHLLASEILKELYMALLGRTQQGLADHLGSTRVAISEIVNGRRGVSPEMALKLADPFSTSPELWENLQSDYGLHRAKAKHKTIPPIGKISS